MKKLSIMLTVLAIVSLCAPAMADVYWAATGAVSNDWSNAANWNGGLPTAATGVINPGGAFGDPVVSNLGNTTSGQIYLSVGGVTLTVASGGRLDIGSDYVTGIWGNSGVTTVSGILNMGNYLNMGAGGFDGDLSITGGTVTSVNLSINTLGGATMDISGAGKYIAPISNLGNINYWVTNGAITGNGIAKNVNIDTTTESGKVILTAIPEPATLSMLVLGSLAMLKRRRS
jgi:hypothetical protein